MVSGSEVFEPRTLSALEVRALGVLIEKQHTVPDSYPMSVNALLSGCNQKTAREPVMQASEAELLIALDGLKAVGLAIESSGSRVMRWEHNTARVLKLPGAAVAVLALLMLRGPQTAAELRANTERLHRFADISSVEGFLEELAQRSDEAGGALVRRLARAAGTREVRWAQQLGVEGEDVALPLAASASDSEETLGELAALRAQHEQLQSEVATLREQLQHLAQALGVVLS